MPSIMYVRMPGICVAYAYIKGRQAIQSLALDDINAILVADILVQSEVRHKIAAPRVQPLHVAWLGKRGQTDRVFRGAQCHLQLDLG